MLADITINEVHPPGSVVIPGPTPAPPIYNPPVFPAHPIAPGGGPVFPTHPIYNPPVFPAHPIVPGTPPVASPPIFYPPVFPAHPIVIPPPPVDLPPAPENWKWAYSVMYGWVLVPPGEGGKPQPIPPNPPTDPNQPVVAPL